MSLEVAGTSDASLPQHPSPVDMPSRSRQSHQAHSGFGDLLNLVTSPSRLSPPEIKRQSRSPSPSRARQNACGQVGESVQQGLPDGQGVPLRGAIGARGERAGRGRGRGGKATSPERIDRELRKRKVNKNMIGPPTDFRHIFHASTFEEATELLLRWAVEGVHDKLGDPVWAGTVKALVKTRAKEQQARAIAAVVEATARSRQLGSRPPLLPFGQLHVVNGLPSSIYSTTNTSLLPATSHKAASSISPLLMNGSTPNLIANYGDKFSSYFDNMPGGLKTPTSPLLNPYATPPTSPPDPSVVTPVPVILPQAHQANKDTSGKTQPLRIKKKPKAPEMVKLEQEELAAVQNELKEERKKPSSVPVPAPDAPSSTSAAQLGAPAEIKRRKSSKGPRPSPQDDALVSFRIVNPSLETLEKAMSIALFFESYYHALLKSPQHSTPTKHPVPDAGNYLLTRAQRLAQLETSFLLPENRFMSEAEKEKRREELMREENLILRERRRKVDVKGFELGRVIGHGAFGVVRIAREKESGRLVAMKQLRKTDMLRKSQEGHVKAEKDLLAAASSRSHSSDRHSWIVQLHYAFQDTDHLYLILQYMGGGDLLNLLVERDTFSESMTRFYIAEMVLALQETHQLGYIHRDIKPDNFLFTPDGHIRISDFGLSTDLHWMHDTNYYEQQRKALLKRHGVDLEWPTTKVTGGKGTRRMKREEVERIMGKEWLEQGKGVLTWREGNRRKLAYSVCGTNSYMAPEVIRGQGYGFSCDWWSLGVIMYEALYGYPPFLSSSQHLTRQKILNWKSTLKFPPKPRLSPACTDFMTQLLCEPEDRIGSSPASRGHSVLTTGSNMTTGPGLGDDGAERIKQHMWFAGVDWDNLHRTTPPYQPQLASDDDTRYFDQDIPDEPLAAAGGVAAIKDPLLRDTKHGQNILEIRKSLAFKGWTFKSPAANAHIHLTNPETRYGHLEALVDGRFSAGSEASGKHGHEQEGTDETIVPNVIPASGVMNAFDEGKSEEAGLSGFGTVRLADGTGTVRSRALSL